MQMALGLRCSFYFFCLVVFLFAAFGWTIWLLWEIEESGKCGIQFCLIRLLVFICCFFLFSQFRIFSVSVIGIFIRKTKFIPSHSYEVFIIIAHISHLTQYRNEYQLEKHRVERKQQISLIIAQKLRYYSISNLFDDLAEHFHSARVTHNQQFHW